MGLFGKKPKLRTRSAGFNKLAGALVDIQAGQAGLTSQVQANLRDLARGRKSDLRSLTDARAADVAFAASRGGPTVTLAGATDRAIARGRGLSKVIEGTKTEFNQGLLRERIAAVRGGLQRQGQGLAGLAQVGGFQDRLAKATQETKDVKSEARADIFGTGVGIAAEQIGGFLERDKPNKPFAGSVDTQFSDLFGVSAR